MCMTCDFWCSLQEEHHTLICQWTSCSTVLWREATEWPNLRTPLMKCESHCNLTINVTTTVTLTWKCRIRNYFFVGYVAVMRSWRSAGMRSLRRGLSSPSWSTVWGTCWQTAIRRCFIYYCCIQPVCPLVAGWRKERKKTCRITTVYVGDTLIPHWF